MIYHDIPWSMSHGQQGFEPRTRFLKKAIPSSSPVSYCKIAKRTRLPMARDCKKQPRFGKFYRPQKPKHRNGMDVLTLHPLDLTDHGFKSLLVMFVCVCCWLRFWSWYNVYYCAAVGHTVVRTSMFVSGALPHKGISQKNLSEKMNAIHKCPRKMLETLAWKSVTLQCHTHAGNFVKWRVKFGYCITTSIFHRQSFWSCSLELCRKLAHENTLKPNNLAQITCMVHMGKCKSWHFVPPNGLTKIFHECALENSCWHSSPYFEK